MPRPAAKTFLSEPEPKNRKREAGLRTLDKPKQANGTLPLARAMTSGVHSLRRPRRSQQTICLLFVKGGEQRQRQPSCLPSHHFPFRGNNRAVTASRSRRPIRKSRGTCMCRGVLCALFNYARDPLRPKGAVRGAGGSPPASPCKQKSDPVNGVAFLHCCY